MNQSDSLAATQLGMLIATLRKSRGLTGSQLGERVHLSQSKISKIEKGQQPLVSVETLSNILAVLQASGQDKLQADLLAAQANIPSSLAEIFQFNYQTDVHLDLQANASSIWEFTANMIPLLLQIPEYRRDYSLTQGFEGQRLNDNLKETAKRQDLLWDIKQNYYIFFLEATLYTRPSSIQVQLAQLDRLERMLGMDNCKIGIIPTEAGSCLFPLPACMLYDKKIIMLEAGDRDLMVKDPRTITLAIKAFKELDRKSYQKDDAKALIRKAQKFFMGTAKDIPTL